MAKSRAEKFARLPREAQEEFLADLTPEEIEALQWDWNFWGRPEQLPPPLAADWRVWLILAGRGFGKTRAGAEFVRALVNSGDYGRIACVAPTSADGRDVMVEGESGILSICPNDERPEWQPSKNKLTFPNGAEAHIYPSTEPDRLRGPQFHAAWCDELASWDHLDEPYNAWVMLQLTLRLGRNPKICATTTPKPIKLLRRLVEDERTCITKGSTYDNKANLAKDFIKAIEDQFEGTRVGRQELYAEILDDVPGALWPRDLIERQRWRHEYSPPPFTRVVMGIDPAVGGEEEGAGETGIIIVARGSDGQGFVLADASTKGTANDWVQVACRAYHDFNVDRVVGEINNGGDLIERVLRGKDPNIAYKTVRATRNKLVRAEPISALYEQRRVWHLGMFPELEDQMSRFTPEREFDSSPDHADALVWALTELMLVRRDPVPFMKVKGNNKVII